MTEPTPTPERRPLTEQQWARGDPRPSPAAARRGQGRAAPSMGEKPDDLDELRRRVETPQEEGPTD